MDTSNPFALVRASNYSDAQINSLWVEMGPGVINAVIEPRARDSKYILGGKGTGKTHLLRYHSYPVIHLRSPAASGLETLLRHRFLAIFIRAASVDPGRFVQEDSMPQRWQQLFGVYFELRLVEILLESLTDIRRTSPDEQFDDSEVIRRLAENVNDDSIRECQSLNDLHVWVQRQRLQIDGAVNNFAFSGQLDVRIPFALGGFCIAAGLAVQAWNPKLADVPLIYLVDEIENFSEAQQEVLNTLVRFGEGFTTFRMTGRLYSRKTARTLAAGEENREGAEFRTSILDDVLRRYRKYPEFARRFVAKRLSSAGLLNERGAGTGEFDARTRLEQIEEFDFFKDVFRRSDVDPRHQFVRDFRAALLSADVRWHISREMVDEIIEKLIPGLPLLVQRLNVLLFCKKMRVRSDAGQLAERIRADSERFVEGNMTGKESYAIAFGHYRFDLFAQLCRDSKRIERPVYGGFDAFVRMSTGNPRNLLVLLGRLYEIAAFKGINFVEGPKLSVQLQTQAAVEASRFMFERDSNYGTRSDIARQAVERLAVVLRNARFALNIPEVSPLAISFASGDLSDDAKQVLADALNYSLLFELGDGRPDRNSEALHRKVQLAPMLSPRWGLAITRGGDIKLPREMLNAIFDVRSQEEFEGLLRAMSTKWNAPFRATDSTVPQTLLF